MIEKRHVEVAKQLKEDKNMTIRKVDKADVNVIMNASESQGMNESVLSDNTKFVRIKRDRIEALKKKINRLIASNSTYSIKLDKLSGDCGTCYCYGNVKTQTRQQTQTYYLTNPHTYLQHCQEVMHHSHPMHHGQEHLKSATDFLDIVKSKNCSGTIGSLDEELLLTNVPFDCTIDYIISRVNHNDFLQ